MNEFRVERVEEYPLRMYLEGHEPYFKGLPTQEAVCATDKVKKLLLRPFFVKKKALKILNPHILPKEQMTEFSRAILELGGDWALILAYVLEYDSAYRFRLQDLANETERLTPREVLRLFKLWKQRDENEIKHKLISKKFTLPAYAFALYLFLNPTFSAKLNRALPCLKPDSNDLYWMKLKTDYHYAGS